MISIVGSSFVLSIFAGSENFDAEPEKIHILASMPAVVNNNNNKMKHIKRWL